MCNGGSSPATAAAAPPQQPQPQQQQQQQQQQPQQQNHPDRDPVVLESSSSSSGRGGRRTGGGTTTEQSTATRPATRSMVTRTQHQQHRTEFLKSLLAVQKELVQRTTTANTTTTTTTRPTGPSRAGWVWNSGTGTWDPVDRPGTTPSAPPLLEDDDHDDDDATNLSFPSPPQQQRSSRRPPTREIGTSATSTTPSNQQGTRTGPPTNPPSSCGANALDSPAHRTRKRVAEARGWSPPVAPPRQKPHFLHTTPAPSRPTLSGRSSGVSILECVTATPATAPSSGGPVVVVVVGKPTPVSLVDVRGRRCKGEPRTSRSSSAPGSRSNPPTKRNKPSSLYRSSLERLFDGPDAADTPPKLPPSSEPPSRRTSRQRTHAKQSKASSTKASDASRGPVPRCANKPTQKSPAGTTISKSPDVDVAQDQHVVRTSERGSLPARQSQEPTKCRGVALAVERVANQAAATNGPAAPRDTGRGVQAMATHTVDVVRLSLPTAGVLTQNQAAPLPRTRGRSLPCKNPKKRNAVDLQVPTSELAARQGMPAAEPCAPAKGPPTRMQPTPKSHGPTPLRKRGRTPGSKKQMKGDSSVLQDGGFMTHEPGTLQEMPSTVHRPAEGGPPSRTTPEADCPTPLRKRGRHHGSKNQTTGDLAAVQDGVTLTGELGTRQEMPAPEHLARAAPRPGPNVQDRDSKKLNPAAPPHKEPPIKQCLQTRSATCPEGLNSLVARAMTVVEQRSPRDDVLPSGSRKASENEFRRESMRLDGLKNLSELSSIHPKSVTAVALDAPSPVGPPVAKLKDPPMTLQLPDSTPPLRNHGRPTGSATRSKRSGLAPVASQPSPLSATANALRRPGGLGRASVDAGTLSVPLLGASTESRRGPGPSSRNAAPRRSPGRPPGARDPRPSGGPPAVVAAPAVTTRHVYQSCGACAGCRLDIDCGACLPCKQTLNFRGLTLLRPVCVQRVCTNPILQKVLEAAAADDEVQSLDGDADSYLEGDLSDVSSLGR